MDFITSQNRQQITFSSLEDKITADNPVRFLEVLMEHLKLGKLRFVVPEINPKGRLSFEPKLF